ncbi:MAG: hypothetical protein JWL72_1364, partial [Ilumatobacteraceae bacterium]|nr:hypothetical protein [Ilumatobacteraceae bacterium]
LEDTLLDVAPLEAVRNVADHVIGKAVDAVTMLDSGDSSADATGDAPNDPSDPTATSTSQPAE